MAKEPGTTAVPMPVNAKYGANAPLPALLKVLFALLAILFVGETIVMFLLPFLHLHHNAIVENFVDSSLLAILCAPFIWVLISGRKRAEEGLAASEDALRLIYNSVYDAIFIHGLNGAIIDVNDKMLEMFGIDRDQALRLTIAGDYSGRGNPLDELPRIWKRVRAGEALFFEWKARRPLDGSEFDVEVFLRKIVMKREEVILATVRDITTRKQAEAELRKLFLAVEQSPGSIVITDPKGTIEYVNARFTQITGYSKEEAIGKNPRILKSGETKAADYAELWRTITSGRDWEGEFRNRKKNGEFFWEHAKISPLIDAAGTITHFVAIKEDITARKQTEQALQAERQRLFSVLENLPGFVCLKAPDHSISFTNRCFRECFGDVKGRPCYEAIRGRQEPCEFCPAQVVTDKGLQVWEMEGRNNRTYQMYDYPFTDIDGSPLTLALGIDITDRKRAEEEVSRLNANLEQEVRERTSQLLDAQEELVRKEKLSILGQLSGSVGHELRNPLGVMSNAVYFLKMVHADGDALTREYLDMIKHEIDNSQRIITDLLDFARTKTPQIQAVSARQLVEESLGQCALPENIELAADLPDTLPLLTIDPLQMGQVFQNLITNAVQAMAGGGALRISARRVTGAGATPVDLPISDDHAESFLSGTGTSVAISVADTGEGISPENRKNLFQPLFTTKAKGIGLGLVVCRNLTEANGGRIAVASEPGTGTVFTVWLPAEEGR